MRTWLKVTLFAALTACHPAFAQTPPETPLPQGASVRGDVVMPDGAGPWTPCLWVRGDYLHWWTKGQSVPPLLTTSPVGTSPNVAGVLGLTTTRVLFGGREYNDDHRPGARLSAGAWLDAESSIGLEGSAFWLGSMTDTFAVNTDGTAILARPFFNALTNQQDALLLGFPSLVSATGLATVRSSDLYGWEGNLRKNLVRLGCAFRSDCLVGYRGLRFDESVSLADREITLVPAPGVPVGAQFGRVDRFSSENFFHGGQFGLATEVRVGRCSLELVGKVALGATCQRVDISGAQVGPGQQPVAGGFLALASNSGRFESTKFAAVPEVQANFGYQVTDHLRLSVGYTFLAISNVARAGDQIDLVVNPALQPPVTLTPPIRPRFPFEDTSFWAQGLNFGLEVQF